MHRQTGKHPRDGTELLIEPISGADDTHREETDSLVVPPPQPAKRQIWRERLTPRTRVDPPSQPPIKPWRMSPGRPIVTADGIVRRPTRSLSTEPIRSSQSPRQYLGMDGELQRFCKQPVGLAGEMGAIVDGIMAVCGMCY